MPVRSVTTRAEHQKVLARNRVGELVHRVALDHRAGVPVAELGEGLVQPVREIVVVM